MLRVEVRLARICACLARQYDNHIGGIHRLPHIPSTIANTADFRGECRKAIMPSNKAIGQINDVGNKSHEGGSIANTKIEPKPNELNTNAALPIVLRCR